MSDNLTGGPASPFMNEHQTDPCYEGMTLRDWFAGQALAGYLAAPTASNTPHQVNATACAEYMYEIADAMLKAKGGKP
jgi:hypothetical protein